MNRTFKTTWILAVVCTFMMNLTAFGLILTFNPADPNLVGTIRPGEPAGDAAEVGYVNTLLGLGANSTLTLGGQTFTTFNTDFNGTAIFASKDETENTSIPLGYQYVLAKYNGPNGGSVVWYLGGESATIPQTSLGLWTNTAGNGYGLSHFALFNPTTSVPDGGATLALLGGALAGMAAFRRYVKV